MMRARIAVGVAGLTLVTAFAGAQSAATGGEKKEVIATGGVISSLVAAPVIGQPYSALAGTSNNPEAGGRDDDFAKGAPLCGAGRSRPRPSGDADGEGTEWRARYRDGVCVGPGCAYDNDLGVGAEYRE